MSQRSEVLERRAILDRAREASFVLGDRFGVKAMVRATGISEAQIYRYWERFGDLREELGLPRRTGGRQLISDGELLADFHRVVQTLNRIPSYNELERESQYSGSVYQCRFGRKDAMVVRYREWLSRQNVARRRETEREAESPTNVQREGDDRDRPADSDWVRETWRNLRVGFAVRSGDCRERPTHLIDMIVCLEHDWAACPVPVLELATVLPARSAIPRLPEKWTASQVVKTPIRFVD